MYKKGVVYMFNKKEFVDPKKIMFAHIARLTDEDLEINKIDNVNIRCTNESYIVGELGKTKDNVPIFLDVMNDDSFGYLYFNTVSDAEYALRPFEGEELFVINAKPLTDLGIYDVIEKEKLKEKLSGLGLIFNFMDEEEVKQKTKVPVMRMY